MGLDWKKICLGDDAVPIAPKRARKTERNPERMKGRFYMVPELWFEQARACLPSSTQLAVAVRLYRHWWWRKRGADFVVASNETLITSDAFQSLYSTVNSNGSDLPRR